MTRFFFHVQDGALYADEHGADLLDQRAARKVALEIVSQLVRDAVDDLWSGGAFCVLVEDDQRAALFTLEVRVRPQSAGDGFGS